MKYLFTIFVLCIYNNVWAQYDVNVINPAIENTKGVGTWIVDRTTESDEVKGSVFLFENFIFPGIVTIQGEKVYRIPKMNYNIQSDQIVARYAEDSIFVFDKQNIEKVTIADRTFKVIRNPVNGQKSVYEVLASSNDRDLLKRYSVSIKEGVVNRMTNKKQTSDRYIVDAAYFVTTENGLFNEVKLKRKAFVKYFPEYKGKMEDFVEENNLSYKDENDLRKIFSYYGKLQDL